ncbi:MAG: hypothetical protein FWC71_00105 [Defluviitaleaceae bacterium]|nr:hypothetical protein [Defluviitaleaceae bacterium]
MTDGVGFRQHVRDEIAKMRAMNFTDRRQYIWEYYKMHIIGLLIGIFALGAFINTMFINPAPRDYLYIAWLGPQPEIGQLEALAQALQPLVPEDLHEVVSVHSYAASFDPMMNTVLQQRFATMVQIGGMDAILTTSVGVQELIDALDWLRPIYELPGAPIAVSLYGSPLLYEVGIDSYDLYLSMLINTANVDRILRMLDMLLDGVPAL